MLGVVVGGFFVVGKGAGLQPCSFVVFQKDGAELHSAPKRYEAECNSAPTEGKGAGCNPAPTVGL